MPSTKQPFATQRLVLVGAGEPALSDHIRRQNRGKFPGLGHDVLPPQTKLAQ